MHARWWNDYLCPWAYLGRDRAFVKRNRLSFPSLRDDKLQLAPKYGTTNLPETFVIDRRGRVVAVSRGQITAAFLSHALDRALAGGTE